VVHILEQVCHSLEDAHAAGLVHRDIKPANIQVCRMGKRVDFVKVLDFGLATARSRRRRSTAGTPSVLIVGTPSYVAPEIATGGAVDARADIYSLGCVGYWMLTGRPVFDAKTSAELVARHVEQAAEPVSRRADQPVPAGLERVIHACLEKDPAKRPQDAEELAGSLRQTGLAAQWTQERARAWWAENLG
jgi:serine/threonine-protein kinase